MTPKLKKGLVQVYTGDGKGKTTAALGLALRAASHGFKVAFIQFAKACHDEAAAKLIPHLTYRHFGLPHEQYGWLRKLKPGEKPDAQYSNHLSRIHRQINLGWHEAAAIISKGGHDIVVLDELNIALYFDLLPLSEVLSIVANKPAHVELVITGRQAPKELIKIAHLVTEMKEIKHPYQQGLIARQGIEY